MFIQNYVMYVRTVPLTNCLHSMQCLMDGAQSVQVHRCPHGRKTTDTGLNEHLRQNRSLLCCCTMAVNVTGTSEKKGCHTYTINQNTDIKHIVFINLNPHKYVPVLTSSD